MWKILLHSNIIEVGFTQSARKHRIGRRRIVSVMNEAAPRVSVRHDGVVECAWEGADDRGLVIEVTALLIDGGLLVIHAMPAALRRRP